ncbi:hypothetical protein DENSPDRAFT_500350 [Dentipellis sp. KUC8613]|nr:hypothetical protein DENSPDRAFT_500350 [Dentipellis sp. KUC8613]
MKTTSTLALTLLALLPAALAEFTINTPSGVTECEPVLLSWTEGTPPYYLSLVPAGQPMAQPIKQWAPTQDTSLTWNVDLPANTNFNVGCKDGTGKQVFTALITVGASTSGECKDKDKGASPDTAVLEGSQSGSSAPAATAPASNGNGNGNSNGNSAGPMSLAASTSGTATHTGSSSASGSASHTGTGTSSSASASSTASSHKANSAAHGSVALTTVFGVALGAALGFVRFGWVGF